MGLNAIKKAENLLDNPRDLFLFYVKESVRACVKSDKNVLIYLLSNFRSFFDERSSELDKSYYSIFDRSVFSFINYKKNLITDYDNNIEIFLPPRILPDDLLSKIQDEINEIEKKLVEQENDLSFGDGSDNFVDDEYGFDIFAEFEYELKNKLVEKKDILFGRGLNCHFHVPIFEFKEQTCCTNIQKPEFEIQFKVRDYTLNPNLPSYLILLIGKTLSRHALCRWFEDFVDEDSGEIFSIEGNDIVVEKESVLTIENLMNIYERATEIWIYNDDLVAYYNNLMDCLNNQGADYFIENIFNKLDIKKEKDRIIISRLFFDLILADRSEEFEHIITHFFSNIANENSLVYDGLNELGSSIIHWVDYLMKEYKDETVQYIVDILHKHDEEIYFPYLSKIAYVYIKYYFDSGLLILSDKYMLSESDLADLKFIYMINENDFRYLDKYVFSVN
jgi:hypothetical protein